MTTETSSNPFTEAEAWKPGGRLPPGDYVAKVIGATDPGPSKGGHNQIELDLQAREGSIKDWIVYHSDLLGKVVALFDAAGIDRPKEGEFDASTFNLTEGCLQRLYDKKVGIVVREEPDFKDPTKMRSRVQGYMPANRIMDEVPIDTGGLPSAGAASSTSAEDEIPF